MLKRDELSSHEKTWSKLNCILLHERRHSEELHTAWFQLYEVLGKARLWRCKNISDVKGLRRVVEGWVGRADGNFRAVKILCVTLGRMHVCVLVVWSCPTLCNSIGCSPPGPSVHGILQAGTLECDVTQSCPTLCDPMDCSLQGSSICGISLSGRIHTYHQTFFQTHRSEP